MRKLKWFSGALLVLASTPALWSAGRDQDPASGWIRLFNGTDRFGWVAPAGNWKITDSALVADGTSASRIYSDLPFADFTLRFDVRITGGPADVVVRLDPESKPAQPGIHIGLTDGSLEGQHGNASLTAGAQSWRQFEIRAEGDQLSATINGMPVAAETDGKSRIGAIQFEVPKGSRLEVRSVWLKPISLNNLYNGTNLDGWRAVNPKEPEKKSGGVHLPNPFGKSKPPKVAHWSGDGAIRGTGGEGQLETVQTFQDFLLQMSAKVTGSQHGGIAVAELLSRGSAGQYASGYAVDLSLSGAEKAVAPGSLLSPEKVRMPGTVADGVHPFTVINRGRRFAMWVDGHEVMDDYDSRAEGTYHATAGPLSILVGNEHASVELTGVSAATLPQGPQPAPAPTASPAPAPVAAVTPQQTATAATTVPAFNLPPMPGQSPEDKARAEQVRTLTVQALETQSPEEAVRINKQILTLDPSDMPAQQRLDKAQAKLDTQSEIQEHVLQLRLDSNSKLEQNVERRDALMQQVQDALLHGKTNEARDRLNDAERLGAKGPEVDHLNGIIHQRIRNRILLWSCLGTAAVLALIAGVMAARRRRQVVVGYLLALDGVEKGRRYLLNQEVTHVGGVAMDTGKKNEVVVRDPDRLVSRFHLEVHKRKNLYYVIDLDSSNGTYLNGRRLPAGAATRLRSGDRLALANAVSFTLQLSKS